MTFIINFSNFYILTTFLFLSKYATKSCLKRPNPPACMYDVSTKLSSSITNLANSEFVNLCQRTQHKNYNIL